MRKLLLLFGVCLSVSISSLQAQVLSTATGGNWSDPGTWVGSVVPTPADQVIIADGADVVIDVDATILSLTIGQGSSGLLRYQATGPVNLTVSADVQINTGAVFRTANSGTETGHTLSLGGSLINQGELDFSTNGNSARAGITFTGASNTQFTGNGVLTDIDRLTINKGNSVSSILELNPAVFSVQGSTNTPALFAGYLDIQNGMFKVGGTFSMSNGLFAGAANYTIPPTAGLWMANPNYTVLGRDGTLYLEGTLIMDAGVLNVGNSTGNRLGYIAGTAVYINGGEINVASRFTATTTYGLTYVQTGGTMTVNTVENPRDLYASFDIRPIDNSSFTMSGGRIVIQHANISGTGPRDYNMTATNMNITGGTLQIGNANTVGLDTFYIQGFAPDIEINNASGLKVIKLLNNMTVFNTSIPSGCVLKLHDDANGFAYTQIGTTLLNEGIIDGSLNGSSLVFSGQAGLPQTYSGAGVIQAPLNNLTVSNLQPVNFGNSLSQDIITRSLTLNAGNLLLNNNTLVLGTSDVLPGTFTYTSGTLVGKFKRWITASLSSWNFPVGITNLTRSADINFTTAPSVGGTLTAEFIAQPGGFNGLPLIDGGNTILNTASDGYWRITAADGLSGGLYTGTFTVNGFTTVTDFSKLVLVKRSDESNPWVLDGVHIPATGTNALAIAARSGMSGFSDFAVGGDLTALPVTVLYFRGKSEVVGNWLEWQLNCYQTAGVTMELQRSQDGRMYKTMYSRYASAVECLSAFRQLDESPATGMNYYRLKLTDADGKQSYSAIVVLSHKSNGIRMLQLYPNPVQSAATLQIAASRSAIINLVISDNNGRIIRKDRLILQSGINQVPLLLERLAPGAYQLSSYMESGESQTIPLIKE